MTRIKSTREPAELLSSKRGQRLTIALALAAGLLLRLWFIFHAARIAGDTLVYGDIAKNWLDQGIYGFTQTDAPPLPTLIRLPGYPAFLAVCFSLFGREHYTAVMLAQTVIDLGTCLLLAALAGRLFGQRAWRAALWVGALCPFTASYVAAPLAETLTLACIALTFYAFQRWSKVEKRAGKSGINRWIYLLSASLAYAILLRPEQGLLAAAVLPAMLWIRLRPKFSLTFQAVSPILLTAFLTILPLVPWTYRNWHTLHVIQPLAPRYANDPGETVPLGFQRWYRTWAIDFTSTEDVYWNYDGATVEISDVPTRAFDNAAQYAATDALLAEYDETARSNPRFDARFDALARQRIHADPIRYYVALPVARLLNMALRPRTEMLPIPLEWWKLHEHPGRSAIAIGFALVNLAYFVAAGLGFRRWHSIQRAGESWHGAAPLAWAMIATIVFRCLLLLTLDNSEPRYTLEFFPVFIVAISALFATPARSRLSPRES
jgi:hypothetical protein